jgi:hypothetical protein
VGFCPRVAHDRANICGVTPARGQREVFAIGGQCFPATSRLRFRKTEVGIRLRQFRIKRDGPAGAGCRLGEVTTLELELGQQRK